MTQVSAGPGGVPGVLLVAAGDDARQCPLAGQRTGTVGRGAADGKESGVGTLRCVRKVREVEDRIGVPLVADC